MLKVPVGTPMTGRLLEKLITKHKTIVASRYSKLNAAYCSDYDIYNRPAKDDYKPDNRIGVNFAKYLVDTMTGFFCGIPIVTTTDDEQLSAYVQQLLTYNFYEDEDTELAKLSSIFGTVYEMYYVDENAELCMVPVSPMQGFMVTDDSVLERPMYFIRYYLDANNEVVGSYSDANIVRHFKYEGGEYKFTDEDKRHGFGKVPAAEFRENTERLGLFESVLSMINEYNKALSEKANDVDYFSDAYLKVIGAEIDTQSLNFIRRNRVIAYDGNGGSTPEVDFLAKPDADQTQEHLLDRLERLIFKVSMVANINDESFGNASGVALRYKLWDMTTLAGVKRNKFIAALNNRYDILFSNPLAKAAATDWVKLNYQFTLNYPANLESEVDIATKLQGIVSEKTQLSVLSIVDDPEAELKRKADEAPQENVGFN